ncbi:BTAD domain-containing putative transcriptional regulator [Tengunoibacter tsumagoiensis]|uniref:Bacterial transcriptional activator domain-containing protein n=1 Tax=Tengunoibacter tsumagoiensis TaxID=2014871 RepID=A0A402A9Q1_9CHLR|nr:BTAD domain-containing putative transcriptional regulator [Tengunoibacter tsumagoiensis]GCE15736.1 hypothetical protein KTT_55950 [Tengunoibacter tsumagoiensis]
MDCEPRLLLDLLITSIRQRFPDFHLALDECLHEDTLTSGGDLYHYPALIDALVSAIKRSIHERFLIVLSSYQKMNEYEPINALVDYLLQRLPSNCVMIIESRSVPKLHLAPLMVRRQIVGLGVEQLRFTPEDIHTLSCVMGNIALTQEDATQLCAAFDGWIAGILLGTRLGNTAFLSSSYCQEKTSLALPGNIDYQHVFAYLLDDVFKDHPDEHAFLRDLSILERIMPDICNGLLSIQDAEQRLMQIEKQGLFVSRLQEESDVTYLFHPILRALLLTDLMTQDEERFKQLHYQVSVLYSEREDYQAAVAHALLAQAFAWASELLRNVAKPMLRQGDSETMVQWMNKFPVDVVERDPFLLVVCAKIHLLKHETEQCDALIEKGLSLLEAESSDAKQGSAVLKAEMYIIKSNILFRSGNYYQASQMSQQALTLLPSEERELKGQAYQYMGACACLSGNCKAGITYLQQALRLWNQNAEGRQISLLHMYLANAYNIVGNYTLAEYHRKRSIQKFECLGDIGGKVHSLIGLSTTIRLKGMGQEAEEILQKALLLSRQSNFSSGEAYALLALGEFYQDTGNYEQSLSVIEDGLLLAQALHDSLLTNNALCTLAMTYLFMGDSSSAQFLVSEVEARTVDSNSQDYIVCQLTKAMVHFWQKQYQEAEHCLLHLDQLLTPLELKQLHIRVFIYYAACKVEQGQLAEMRRWLERAALFIQQIHYEYNASIELRRLPRLWQALPTIPALHFLLDAASVSPPPPQESDPPAIPLPIVEEAVPLFQVFALGEPYVLVKGERIKHWRMARAMELFFFLLDAGRPVHKEQIMAALWPADVDHVEQSLRTIVYHLRRVLGNQAVIFRSGTYELDLDALYGPSIWYDMTVFFDLSSQAKQLLLDGEEEHARPLLQQLVSLYKGDYVQSFYSDWCIRRRDEARTIYVEALRQLAIICEKDTIEQSLMYWQHMLAVDNCLEEAHAGIIRCYLKQGKRGYALRQYQLCEDTLQEELAISPGVALQKLYKSLV